MILQVYLIDLNTDNEKLLEENEQLKAHAAELATQENPLVSILTEQNDLLTKDVDKKQVEISQLY